MTSLNETSSQPHARSWLTILLATTIFSGLSICVATISEGFIEADACTHYIYARFALHEPHYLLNVWGRPFVTALYALPAAIGGRAMVRMTTLGVALAIAWVAYRIAKNQGLRWPALAFVFTLAQPLVFLHSFGEMTELPFALLVALAFWAYQKQQWMLMALAASFTPTARPEGFAILLMAGIALIAHRRWWWIFILPMQLLLWQWIAWRLYESPRYDDPIAQHLPYALHWLLWLKHEWPYAAKSLYAAGSIFQFIAALPAVVGPGIFPALLIGTGVSLNQRGALRDHRARCQFLIAAIPFFFLITHSVLYFTGRMASSGEIRYMLIAAPFWSLLMATGWEWIFARFDWRWPLAWAGAAALVPIFIYPTYPVFPLKFSEDWRQARELANWYRTDPDEQYPLLLTSHPGIAYFLDVSPSDRTHMLDWSRKTVAQRPEKTLLIWDSVYGALNSDAARSVQIKDIVAARWIEDFDVPLALNSFDEYPQHWRIFRSPPRE